MTQILTEAARFAEWGQPCELEGGALVEIDLDVYNVNPAFAEAWASWEYVRAAFSYVMPGSDTGHYNCRHIANDPDRPWSEHAWRGLAFDMNWLQNPDGKVLVTDMPEGMPEAIQRIKTNSGEYVFRWGGDWDRDPDTPHTYYDAMHFSVVASRADLETGIDWSTVYGWLGGDVDMTLTTRLEVNAAWLSIRGTHVEPSIVAETGEVGETAQARLTRIAKQIEDGERTIEQIATSLAGINNREGRTVDEVDTLRRLHAGYMPAWVLTEGLEPSEMSDGQDIEAAIEVHSSDPDAHHE